MPVDSVTRNSVENLSQTSTKTTTAYQGSEGNSDDVWPKLSFARVAVCERQGLRPSMEDAAAVHAVLQPNKEGDRPTLADTRYSSFALRGTLKLEENIDLQPLKEKRPSISKTRNQVQAFFGVFDGHGGSASADFVSAALPSCISQEPTLRKNPMSALRRCFELCDEQLFDHFKTESLKGTAESRSGCTAVTVYMDYNHDDKCTNLYCANLGDSRCILVKRDGTHMNLSHDHVPHDPGEKARIEDAGGQVKPARPTSRVLRVLGALSVTRSFGDFLFKMPAVQDFSTEKMIEEDLVLSTPEVIHHKVNPKEDLAVILACDGVWNTFTNEEAALQVSDKLLHRLPASSKRTPATDTKCCADAAQFIVDNAISRGSTDNCTAMVALLEPVVEEHPDVVKANKRSAHCVIL